MPRLPQDPHPRTGPTGPSSAGDARTLRDRGLATSRRLTRALVGITAALVLGLSVLAGSTVATLGGAGGAPRTQVSAPRSSASGGSKSGSSSAPATSSSAPAVTSGAS